MLSFKGKVRSVVVDTAWEEQGNQRLLYLRDEDQSHLTGQATKLAGVLAQAQRNLEWVAGERGE